jgi:hypothetical protein
MSNREQHGLRGPVKTCVEETTYAGVIAADGRQLPESKSRYETEYSVEGRVITRRTHNSDGSEWVIRYTYVGSGRLLKTASGVEGEETTETLYSYDDQGRVRNISDSSRPDNPVTFRYDERGKKTKIQISHPVDYRPNTAVAGSPFECADRAPNLPGGGSATTAYDEHDRPTEVQVHDARGELMSRAVRVYDAEGRVSEEQQILDNPETIIPAEAREEILKSSGASLHELREQLTKLMGGQAGPFAIAYRYDAEGRVRQTHRRIFNEEHAIETTYNEHGDKATEVTRTRPIGIQTEQSTPGAKLPAYSEVRYLYQYGQHGNWTEELVSFRSSPDGAFESSTRRRRSLTYY